MVTEIIMNQVNLKLIQCIVWEGNVNNVLTGGEKNLNWIVVQTMIPPGEGGFYIRE